MKLCNQFAIKRYPTMKFGEASDFTEVNLDGLQEINGGQTDEELVKWLAKTLKTYVPSLCTCIVDNRDSL